MGLFTRSPESHLKSALKQYYAIVDQIHAINAKPYSLMRFHLKRQFELELLDLTIIIANYSNQIHLSDNYKVPITLAKRSLADFYPAVFDRFIPDAYRTKCYLALHPDHLPQLQKHLFHGWFPRLYKLPFMTIPVFWSLANSANPKLLSRSLGWEDYSSYSIPSTFGIPVPYETNQGHIYDHFCPDLKR